MEEKELKTPKHCLSCQYHETYYTKCGLTFYREKRGYCSQQQKLTDILVIAQILCDDKTDERKEKE